MNIFGVGEVEFVLIILIALIIAGPKRLIQWMYVLGKWVAKVRVMWQEASAVIQKELDASGVNVQVPKDLPTRQNLAKTITSAMQPITTTVVQPMQEAMNEVKTVSTELQAAANQATSQLDGARAQVKQTVSNGSSTTLSNTPKTTDVFKQFVKPSAKPAPSAPPPADEPNTGATGSANFGTWSGMNMNTSQDTDAKTGTGA